MMCPQCGGKMSKSNSIPVVFIPERATAEELDDLLVDKVWICNTRRSKHPYFVLHDARDLQAGGWEASQD